MVAQAFLGTEAAVVVECRSVAAECRMVAVVVCCSWAIVALDSCLDRDGCRYANVLEYLQECIGGLAKEIIQPSPQLTEQELQLDQDVQSAQLPSSHVTVSNA